MLMQISKILIFNFESLTIFMEHTMNKFIHFW